MPNIIISVRPKLAKIEDGIVHYWKGTMTFGDHVRRDIGSSPEQVVCRLLCQDWNERPLEFPRIAVIQSGLIYSQDGEQLVSQLEQEIEAHGD